MELEYTVKFIKNCKLDVQMIIQRKNHYRNLTLMSVKIEIAANDMKLQMQTGDVILTLSSYIGYEAHCKCFRLYEGVCKSIRQS